MRYRSSRYQERRTPLVPLVVVGLVALVVGFVAGAMLTRDSGGGTGAASGSPRSSGSGAATAATPTTAATPPGTEAPETPGPTPLVAAPADVLPPGSVVRVAVDVLRVRETPSTDARLLEQLAADQLILVGPAADAWGPVRGGGFDWYPARRIGDLTALPALGEPLPADGAVGWIAAGDAETAYVELVAPRCPTLPASLAQIETMTGWERLACFAATSIAFDGVYGCAGCGGAAAGTFEPAWLATPLGETPISVDPATSIGPFAVRFGPDGPGAPDAGAIVHVTGHFDDPAATGCAVAPGDPPEPIDSRTATLLCRERFVVEAIEVTGTYPDFPSG